VRSGARPRDQIFVSGRLGEAQLGWELAKRNRRLVGGLAGLLKKHLYPEPRIELGRWLVQNNFVSAMMDLSDGLSSDLARLCKASGVGAAIQLKDIPLPAGKFSSAFSEKSRLAAALHGGDDYELLFCVRKDKARRIPPKLHGVALTKIGEVTTKRSVQLFELSGKVGLLRPGGWDPFRS
jgi:thiamine-monophosphate kinase